MEQIGKIQLKLNDNLAPKSQGTIQISPQSSAVELLRQAGAAEWEVALFQLAQDKRHDLAPEILPWWKGKLQTFQDAEICDALRLYSGEFFPSVDAIIDLIERKRQRNTDIKADLYWVEHERNNRDLEKFMQAHEGKTPMQVYCEENREEIKRLDSLVTAGAIRNRVVRGTPPKQQTATGVGEER